MNLDGDIIEKGDMVLKPSDGLWVYAPSAEYSLQSSGQVPQSDIEAILRSGFKLVANSTPVAIDMTEVTVTGYDVEEGSEDEVYIQTLDNAGKTVDKYFWIDVVDGEDVYYGWLNLDGDIIEEGDATLGSGEALWVYAPNSNYSLVIPGVSL